jgi:Ca2+-binding RTX toxin-like protein
MRLPLALILTALLVAGFASVTTAAPPGAVNQAKDGWPTIDGMLLINRNDLHRPLDARPGRDPFGGADASYSCDGQHENRSCAGASGVAARRGHNELLGGHGDDTIYGGPWRDVIWGDYKPDGQPLRQHDTLNGGAGRDHIYASHGWNTIDAGAGPDFVKTHWGYGIVDCGPGRDTLWTARRNLRQKKYKIRNCERVRTGASRASKIRMGL